MTPLNHFLEWAEKEGFYFINGFWYGCPVKFEGMILTTEYLLEKFKEKIWKKN